MNLSKFFFFLLSLFSNIIFSQNEKIEGVLKDSKTKETIPFATILFKENGNTLGTMSNEKGEFTLNYKDKEIEISHIDYETTKLVLEKTNTEILLNQKNIVFEEIIFSNISPQEYLTKIIKDSKIRADKNTLLNTYCREIVKLNNEYTKFSDAQVDYYIKKGNGKSVLDMKQSRAFENKISDSTSTAIASINSFFDVRDYVKYAYNFDRIESLIKDKDYDFERILRRDEKGFEYEFIKIVPKEEVEELLYEGYIVVDTKTESILEYKIEFSKAHKKYSKLRNLLIAKIKLNDNSVWVKFRITDNKYVLTYYKNSFSAFIQMGKKVHDNISSTCDIFVYNYKYDIELPKKGYSKKSIFEAGTNYTKDFWKLYNSFSLQPDEEKFINKYNK